MNLTNLNGEGKGKGYMSLPNNEGDKNEPELQSEAEDNKIKEENLGHKIKEKMEDTQKVLTASFDQIIVPDKGASKEVSKCALIIRVIISSFFFCAWIILYLLSLYSCQKSQAECLQLITQDTALIIGLELFSSAFVFVLLCVLAWFQIAYRIFLYVSLPIMYYLFYVYDTGADLASHGSYNRAFFYLFIFVTSLALSFLYLFVKLLIQHPKKTIFTIFSLTLIIYLSIKDTISTSCDYWDKGFKESKILKGGACNLPKPNTCFLYYTSNFWDVTKIRGINCRGERSNEEYEILEWANKTDAKRIGFPRTEHWSFFPESTLSQFNKNIFKNMIDMDKEQEKAKNVEVYVDYSKSYPEVHIQVKKNETLIKERSEIYENNKNKTMFKNVLFIYIDSLSRNNFRRKLQKTFKWLEDNHQNPESNLSTYQFMKYHSLNYYTYANMIPGFFGVHKFEGKGKYFLYNVKQAGYITGQSYDVCERETWDLEMAFEPYLDYTNYDHEFNGFYCDPLFSDPDRPYGALKGAYSIVRKCMYGKDAGEHQVEYAKQFFDTYKDQPKFFRIGFLDAHEGTGEVIKYMDDPILDLITYLESKGHLEDTLIQFQSDHGVSMPGPIYLFKPIDYYLEVFLPSLFYVIPKKIQNFEQINENLLDNENKFITPFDTHAGLINIFDTNITSTQIGISLFSNKVDENKEGRNCNSLKIETKYCMCHLRSG